jgi:hypothetical protein
MALDCGVLPERRFRSLHTIALHRLERRLIFVHGMKINKLKNMLSIAQQFSFWPAARAETVRRPGFGRSSKLKTA